jgi:N-acetyl-gamma-glutamyl-phosphate reductase
MTENNKNDMKSGLGAAVASPLGGSRKGAVGIIGGAGYTGGELIRLLINHPAVEIKFIHSRSNAGKLVQR